MNILLTTKLPIEGFTSISEHNIIMPEAPKFTPEELTARLADADILLSLLSTTKSQPK